MTVQHTVVGLPRSGKTTFLAALYHLTDSGEVETRLKVKSYTGDHTYLNAIVRAWLGCDEVQRTSKAENPNIDLLLVEKDTGRELHLAFPDLAGEAFEGQIEQRVCLRSYVEGCNSGGGILLFVSPDRPADEGMTVVESNATFGPADAESEQLAMEHPITERVVQTQPNSQDTVANLEEGKKPNVKPWTHKLIPAQVQLVDLLQVLQSPPFQRCQRRLAVLVSAWDLVSEPTPTPEEWLSKEMPLLHQFLHANQDSFYSRVYGVSALGGDIKDTQRRDELMAMMHSERIVCVGPECGAHDLAAPILWLHPAS